jgi:hypothetical protein
MIQKNGRKEKNECQATNTLANTAENSYPQMTTFAPSVEKLTQLDLNDARNVETQ